MEKKLTSSHTELREHELKLKHQVRGGGGERGGRGGGREKEEGKRRQEWRRDRKRGIERSW